MFESKPNVTRVVIPSTVTTAEGALEGCTDIKTIGIPGNTTSYNIKQLN